MSWAFDLVKRRPVLFLLLFILLASAGVGAYFLLRPRGPVVPPLSTEGLDHEVVAAIDKARAAVEESPDSASTWGQLGMVLFAHNRLAEAAMILAEAERLDANDVRWPYLRGLALLLEFPADGLAALERAAAIRPGTPTVRLRLAEEYLKQDRIDEADSIFRELLADSPRNPRALLGRGQILSRRGQWRVALEPLTIAAGHPTAQRSARVALAEAYLRLKETAAADEETRKLAVISADQIWPDPILAETMRFQTGLKPRLSQAAELLGQRNLGAARDLVEQVLLDHPKAPEAHVMLARVLMMTRDLRGAERTLNDAIALRDDVVEAHYLLAGTYMLQKNYPAAERSYLRAIELKPSHGMAHFNLGDCRLKQGNRPGAIEAFRAAVRYQPDLSEAHVDLGALLLADGKIEKAIEHLEDALRVDGKSERARRLLDEAQGKKKM